ncbi:hypothetical protein HU200_015684 [Digitaria exilis]|uniref:Uncharacterized protein n=1 Tax=Digitaria exilis TaxID=1010633 RepID=A0A835F906_9POAL|nr:hypothetical protein HU200_015684 [Digitaria exilis]CAB3456210.1 unnamed protein product [Digitaria exilis]
MATTRRTSLAGENKSTGKEHRGRKLDGISVGGREEEGGGKGITAFVNSNVQVINNSLMLQSSCNGGDPGVHLKLSTKSKKKGGGGEDEAGRKK